MTRVGVAESGVDPATMCQFSRVFLSLVWQDRAFRQVALFFRRWPANQLQSEIMQVSVRCQNGRGADSERISFAI